MENRKSYIIIPVSNIKNLDQHGIIDRTPFYFQPTTNNIAPEILLMNPDLQTYKLCVKRDFYNKCASKSYNIFGLIDGYFTDINLVSSTNDVSFNYSMTSKYPIQKYKLVVQALINWFSATYWWQEIFPKDKVGLICLTTDERKAVCSYPKMAKGGAQEQIIIRLCARIDNLVNYITLTTNGVNPKSIQKIWVKFCNPLVNIRHGAEIKPSIASDGKCSGYDVFNYLMQHTGLKQICKQEYQGNVDFLLLNLPPANPELCLSVFIRGNKLIGFSQSDLTLGYLARLSNLLAHSADQLIHMTIQKWQELICNRENGYILGEYEDVVLTIELVPVPSFETHGQEFLQGIQIWNIEMGYGAWTQTGSKLFTWAELELLTGTPPVIKLISPT